MITKSIRKVILFMILLIFITSCKSGPKTRMITEIETPSGHKEIKKKREYFLHRDIKTTCFYIGQKDAVKSGVLDNGSSAWMSDWVEVYGGIDYPDKRDGYFPKGFFPNENPFYCALPYNDIDKNGYKKDIEQIIPWFEKLQNGNNDEFISFCKNRWVRIVYGERVCYAQWEDVGPFETDNWQYVFGEEQPKNIKNGGVGLDISPACFQYLGMNDNDFTHWQFVDFKDVPDGPWLRVITISNPMWN